MTRVREPKPDIWGSSFGTILTAENIEYPTSKSGRIFRNRYRLPYNLFRHLVMRCTREKRNTFRAQNYIPIEFKIMIALKILGKGLCQLDLKVWQKIREFPCQHAIQYS